MIFRTLITICALLLAISSVAAQDMDNTSEPRLSYMVCDWGLLTIEHPTEQPDIFITIDSPANYSAVDATSFTVAGQGAGLFEGNVVVEVTADGDVLFVEPTVLQADEIGAVGDWSLDVELGELDAATLITVTASSPSPADGSLIAIDQIQLSANSEIGLPFVEITRPIGSAGVSASPLLIEGIAGGAFENNIVIEVRDTATGDLLTETFATVNTDTIAGSGPFSTEVDLEVDPGTGISVSAYQSAITDADEVTITDTQFAVVSPLAQSYDRFLTIRPDDPLNMSDDVCSAAASEFDNESINPLVINDVQVMSTMSMMPLVNVNIDAAGSSNCAAPRRTRIERDGNSFAIEIYDDATEAFPCTADLAPFVQRVSLGTLPDPDYIITVNGESVD